MLPWCQVCTWLALCTPVPDEQNEHCPESAAYVHLGPTGNSSESDIQLRKVIGTGLGDLAPELQTARQAERVSWKAERWGI